jgi:hypothetical protein
MSTIDDQLSAYQRQGYNVLIPRTGIRKISAFHDTVLETVSLTIANGDVYPHDESDLAKAKKFRLSKLGLLKLSHAAGIVWRWEDTHRIDTMATPTYVAYQAVGALPQADGTWLPLKASYELDLDVIEAELRELYRKRVMEVRQGQKPKPEAEVQAYITQHVQQDLLRKRKHKLRLAETGAMLAVIRSLLAIKSVYTREELERPFIVPHVIFSPDVADPEIRRALLASSLRATQDLYGMTPAALTFRTPVVELPPTMAEEGDEPHPAAEDGYPPLDVLSVTRTPDVYETIDLSLPTRSTPSSITTPAPAEGVRHAPAAPVVSPASAASVTSESQRPQPTTRLSDSTFAQTLTTTDAPQTTPPSMTPPPPPPDAAVPGIHSLEDLSRCPQEQIASALRQLMHRKGLKETWLTNSNIDQWKPEQQRSFVKMLLSKPDVAAATEPQATLPAA